MKLSWLFALHTFGPDVFGGNTSSVPLTTRVSEAAKVDLPTGILETLPRDGHGKVIPRNYSGLALKSSLTGQR